MKKKIIVRLHFPVLQLTRHYYKSFTEFDDVTFTLDPVERCDYLIVVNRASKDIRVSCPAENIWLFFQEHGHPKMHRWMHDQHDDYSKIFTPHPKEDSRYVKFFTPMAWLHRKSHSFLKSLSEDALNKEPGLVAMWGRNIILSGHRKRAAFWSYLRDNPPGNIPLELWGRGHRPIRDKWDVFQHAAYCLAVENAKVRGYWTEKIMDPFLSYTLPFYYGTEDLGDYFPPDSFIRIDIEKPEESRSLIKEAILTNERGRRIESLHEARRRVLDELSFIPCVTRLIREHYEARPSTQCIVRKFN